jgi:hypothetical protein
MNAVKVDQELEGSFSLIYTDSTDSIMAYSAAKMKINCDGSSIFASDLS